MNERITNLMKNKEIKKKDLTKRKSFSKLDESILDKNLTNAFYKICSFIGRDLNDEILSENPQNYLKFDNFEIEAKIRENDRIAKSIKNICKLDGDVYNIQINERQFSSEIMTVNTIPLGKVPTSRYKYSYQSGTEKFRIFSMKYLYGYFKAIDYCIEEIRSSNGLILSDKFNNFSHFNKKYSYEDFDSLLSGDLFGKRSKTIPLYLLIDVILYIAFQDRNKELTENYNRNTASEYARAFETKKHIPEKIQAIMKTSKFRSDFSYLELDEDTDICKFKEIEKEWQIVKKALHLNKFNLSNPELRFRKLGKHKASGLYYPTLNCICVDIKSPSSFLHELGHCIDYSKKEQLSLQEDFYNICRQYNNLYNAYIKNNITKEGTSYLKRKKEYFNTPTEIFARCFEIYLVKKGLNTSFLKDKNSLVPLGGYFIDNNLNDLIMDYFKDLIDVDISLMEEPKVKIKKSLNNKRETVKPVANASGQYVFNL